ncbi:MAG: monofunctional biosynthetic peptidoglycan transglycosylase [Bacteroidales bacterium]|nr:monofunctional biosynthetic peptidoglycan transglycosylase [Bacteroidales bacterium]
MGKLWRVTWMAAVALVALLHVAVVAYRFIFPPLTPLMVQRFGQQLFQRDRKVNFERDYVRIDAINPNLVNGVVASEDGNFMHHHGFDVMMLKQSYLSNKRGRRVRGGSTISMQTAKNTFLPHRRTMARKAVEAYFTQLIEWTWGKKRIMEVYLNVIEFGDGIYGCEAAAQHYYGHSAATLSKHEAAELAATLPSPLKRNPGHKTPYFRKQTSIIQARASKYGRVRLDKAREMRERDKKAGRHSETLWDFAKWLFEQKKAEGAKDDK